MAATINGAPAVGVMGEVVKEKQFADMEAKGLHPDPF